MWLKVIISTLCILLLSNASTMQASLPGGKEKLVSALIQIGTEVATNLAGALIDKVFTDSERQDQTKKIAQLEQRIKSLEAENSDVELLPIKASVSKLLQQYKQPARSNTDYLTRELTNLSSALQGLQNSYQQTLVPRRIGSFVIYDILAQHQYAENVDIYINNQYHGRLHVNRYFSQASTLVNIRGEGNFNYTLVAEAMFVDQNGQLHYDRTSSSGSVYARPGSHFAISMTPNGIALVASN